MYCFNSVNFIIPEPYICTGHFRTDFTELAKRNNMLYVPPVISRPHRPPSPSSVPVADEKKDKKAGKGKPAEAPPPEPEPEPELDENGGKGRMSSNRDSRGRG